jgi:3-hydroxyisobutyrate dehydrogenase
MTDKLTVSVLGTGIMGAAMAGNLARAGHAVRVWNRGRAKAEPLAADGAYVAESPAEAVSGTDVVVTMLYDGAATLDVMGQAVPSLRPGTARVQATTAGVDAIADLAASPANRTWSSSTRRFWAPVNPPRPASCWYWPPVRSTGGRA